MTEPYEPDRVVGAEPDDIQLDYDWSGIADGRVTLRYGDGSITLPIGDAETLLQRAARQINERRGERWWNS